MICVVMKPEKAPVVNHENLYGAWFNGSLLLRVRARNAKHAEEKFMYLMERETKGKTLDFNLEQQKETAHEACDRACRETGDERPRAGA